MEARRAAFQVTRGGSAFGLQAAPGEGEKVPAPTALRSPGEPLDRQVRSDFEPRFGHDFSRVRVHTDDEAAESARGLHARAYTVGRDIVFGPGRYAPTSGAGRTLIAHELAHVVQQDRAGSPALQLDSELETFPEDERKKVQVLKVSLTQEGQKDIDGYYLNGGNFNNPPERKIQFGSTVAAFRQKGLTSVVGSLTTPPTGSTIAFLPMNSAIDLAIPAAHAIFRFTRFDRPSTAAAGAKGPTPEVVLVEEIGTIPREPKPLWEAFPGPFSEAQGPLREPEAGRMRDCLASGANLDACRILVLGQRPPGAPEPTPVILKADTVEIRKVKVERASGWTENDWGAVSAALTALPDVGLKQAAGVKFVREAKKACKPEEVTAGTCDPERAGETDALAKKITLFDNAFKQSTTRFGVSTALQNVLAHEIGHEADYQPLGSAWSQFKKSKDEKKVLAARSRSGNAWIKHTLKGKNLYQSTTVGDGATKGSFREAALQDGLQVEDHNKKIVSGGVTKYGETSWQELFAESFALYMTDPDLLKATRPNVFKYLETTYPK